MSGPADFLLVAILVLDLYVLATSRLTTCVRASALQGVAAGVLARGARRAAGCAASPPRRAH